MQDIITNIVTAAVDSGLVYLDDVKSELRIASDDVSHDAFLASAIVQVSKSIQTYCGRTFVVETVRDRIYGRLSEEQLILSRFPVVSIISASVADGNGGQTTIVEDTDFIVDAQKGWLYRIGGTGYLTSWFSAPTTVIYTAGYEAIPDDIQQATLRLVSARFHARGRDPVLRSRSQPGMGDETFWIGSVPGAAGPFPDDIVVLLDAYRVVAGP